MVASCPAKPYGHYMFRYPQTQWWDPEVMKCLPYAYIHKYKQCKSYAAVSFQDIESIDVYSDFHKPHEFSILKETLAEKISHSVRYVF